MSKTALTKFKHIAIVQTAFLGDVALALPLAQIIKDTFPSTEISFITTPVASPLVATASAIDNVITYDKRGLQSGLDGIKRLAGYVREKQIDCMICLHKSLRTTLLMHYSKPVFSASFNKSTLSFLYKKRVEYKKNLHEIERNLEFLKLFSEFEQLDTSNIHVQLDFDENDCQFVESKLLNNGIKSNVPFVVMATGSVWATKRWTLDGYKKLAQILANNGLQAVLTGSQADRELCNEIASDGNALNFAGETSIPQSLHLFKISKCVVTNDSSPIHFAGLVDCPVVAIFGATSPIFGFAPRGDNDIILENDKLKCRPCRIHGSEKCPIKTHECMTSISAEAVAEAVMRIIQ